MLSDNGYECDGDTCLMCGSDTDNDDNMCMECRFSYLNEEEGF